VITRLDQVNAEIRAKRFQALCDLVDQGFALNDADAVDSFIGLSEALGGWLVAPPFEAQEYDELLPEWCSRGITELLIRDAIEPLRAAIEAHQRQSGGPMLVEMHGKEYELCSPGSFSRRPAWSGAPLTAHSSRELVVDTLLKGASQKDWDEEGWSRERSRLIEVESRLWQVAAEHGSAIDRIPYGCRKLLLIALWDPWDHEPPGSWTLCIRCGEPLFRNKRTARSDVLPRCGPCMKETPAQRAWPDDAIAPHDRGTWILRCQYPTCRKTFIGRRHRKMCDEHTTSTLPLSRRPSRQRKHS
jgi:hypothetical protein